MISEANAPDSVSVLSFTMRVSPLIAVVTMRQGVGRHDTQGMRAIASTIRGSAVTGYGEGLIKAAFTAGRRVLLRRWPTMKGSGGVFVRGVEFILDIGGQDMKCLKIKDSAIDSIMLNEACSSGLRLLHRDVSPDHSVIRSTIVQTFA